MPESSLREGDSFLDWVRTEHGRECVRTTTEWPEECGREGRGNASCSLGGQSPHPLKRYRVTLKNHNNVIISLGLTKRHEKEMRKTSTTEPGGRQVVRLEFKIDGLQFSKWGPQLYVEIALAFIDGIKLHAISPGLRARIVEPSFDFENENYSDICDEHNTFVK
jgi:hypothetical protein